MQLVIMRALGTALWRLPTSELQAVGRETESVAAPWNNTHSHTQGQLKDRVSVKCWSSSWENRDRLQGREIERKINYGSGGGRRKRERLGK